MNFQRLTRRMTAMFAVVMRSCERFAWVSVNERLPDEMAFYVCRMDVEPDMGTRIDIVFYAIREYGSMAVKETGWARPVIYGWANNTVTHWMPLPRLPRERA